MAVRVPILIPSLGASSRVLSLLDILLSVYWWTLGVGGSLVILLLRISVFTLETLTFTPRGLAKETQDTQHGLCPMPADAASSVTLFC